MSQAENPELLRPDHAATVDEVRALMGASTPHFALQLRNRIRALIRGLPADHPARIEGEREIARLEEIAVEGEVRGHPPESGLVPLTSVSIEHAEHADLVGDVGAAGDGRDPAG
ncbi:MAG: hypothetical protein ACLP8S_11110, partial [Solirubrobacteraceae bacterium]